MKISICIPQYNRIEILLSNLQIIEKQTYNFIEVVVSDDCSTDDTQEKILNLKDAYRFPIKYFRFGQNMGYDRNFRKSMELATGEYCFILGNDDTLFEPETVSKLAEFLQQNDLPDIGYCNYVEGNLSGDLVKRAEETKVHGSGIEVALQHYNGFSFVGGCIFKKTSFEKFNVAKHDGSIYAQMYLSLLMIASGCKLFTIAWPMVIKDIGDVGGNVAWSYYKHGLPQSWSEYKVMDGGLPSVSHVLISATRDALHSENELLAYRILKRIYCVPFPYWIMKYKKYGSLAAAVGLIHGMFPPGIPTWNTIGFTNKLKVLNFYLIISIGGLLLPTRLFEKFEPKLRSFIKRSK